MIDAIQRERQILEMSLEMPIQTVSMHRPSRWTLEQNIHIPGMINSYENTFFQRFKYVSDSRMHWREEVERIVESEEYKKLHILTHAFWYNNKAYSARDILLNFVKNAELDRFRSLENNIQNFNEFLKESDIFN